MFGRVWLSKASVKARIKELEADRRNDSDMPAARLSKAALQEFLENASFNVEPTIDLTDDGELSLSWRGEIDRHVSVRFRKDGTASYVIFWH